MSLNRFLWKSMFSYFKSIGKLYLKFSHMNLPDLLLQLFRGDRPFHFKIDENNLQYFDTGDIILASGVGPSSFVVKEFLHTEWTHMGKQPYADEPHQHCIVVSHFF